MDAMTWVIALVAQLQAKYQLGKAEAQTDVDAFANGRHLTNLLVRHSCCAGIRQGEEQ
jgi:hypothetical protein